MNQVAKILLIDSQNKILLALRDNKPEIPYPNHWGSIGGGIEKDETPTIALKREIKEEISCEVENITQLGEFIEEEFDCKIIMFKGNFYESLNNIQLYEGQKLGLFSFEEFNELLVPPLEKVFVLNHKKEVFGV